ncbi:hypothetical protein ACS4N0_07660 [Levilactobacillus zymae]|uniref:hypothetical protein n=1 Tax=Levilactobacillus zymae TaxID=267363 RepID=UPI003FCC6AF8
MQSWQLKLVGYGAVLVAGGGLGLGLGQPLPAQAAAYRTVTTQKIAKHAYHRKGQHGAVYNRAHTKRVASLRAYPHTTWYATQKATLRHGHTKGVYLYVANASRSVKGVGLARLPEARQGGLSSKVRERRRGLRRQYRESSLGEKR